jgi:hypothetical protein
MLQYALTTQYHIPMYNKYFDKYDFHHMFCNVCYLLLGTVFTGLADGRVVAFKGQDLWDVYLCNQCLSSLKLWVRIPLRRDVLDTTLCDKGCQWLATKVEVFSGHSGFLHQ